jgi:tetratricopeptide (TPR) repeat protein
MRLGAAAAVLALAMAPSAAPAACVIRKFAELPVTMVGTRPLIQARIDGAPVMLMADSGAFYSFLSPGAAAQYHLHLDPAPFDMRTWGVGGSAALSVAHVQAFTLAGFLVPRAVFLVGGSEVGGEAVGLIGQNILGIADVEFDLAGGVIRLMRPEGCGSEPLAYWASRSLTYGMVNIAAIEPRNPHTSGTATINGVKINVVFDTGASMSLLKRSAAKRVGIAPGRPGVTPAGFSGGIGSRPVQVWIAPVASFEIGGEKIEHTRLRIGDSDFPGGDMLLGADFFLSHRVYVANGQHRLYFTYNGGPVFNLTAPPESQATAPTPAPAQAEPADAAAFARRGDAEAARREYSPAIADLTRAIELDPKSPDYPYRRGLAHLAARQSVLAAADFDRTLALAPSDARALVVRATLRLTEHRTGDALADLDAADRVLASAADERLGMGWLYLLAYALPRSIDQYDRWIKAHPDDHRMVQSLAGRCRARAILGQDLSAAMADCQHAIRIQPGWGSLEGRAFVRLRRGDFDKAIADFDQVVAVEPRAAWPLYGRGLAKLKKGLSERGKADIAAATVIDPKIANETAKYGLTP